MGLASQPSVASMELPSLTSDTLDQMYPVSTGKKRLQVQDVTDENMGSKLIVKGLGHYGNRGMGAQNKRDVHVVSSEYEDITRQNADLLEEQGVFKPKDRPQILPVHLQEDGKLVSALIHRVQSESQNGCKSLLTELKNSGQLIPFCHTEYSQFFANMVNQILSSETNMHNERSAVASELLNNKWYTLSRLRAKGVKTAYGRVVFHRDQALSAYRDVVSNTKCNFVYAKECRSASGCGLKKLTSEDDVFELIETAGPEVLIGGLMFEAGIDPIHSNSGVVMHVRPGKNGGKPRTQLVAASDQIIAPDGKTHLGNIWPMKRWYTNMEDVMLKYAELADEIGAYGVMGMDFINDLPTDPNVRYTGSTHPPLILQKYGVSPVDPGVAWLSDNNFKIPVDLSLDQLVNDLESEGLLIRGVLKPGVIVVNHATAEEGKTQLLFVCPVNPKESVEMRRESVFEVWRQFQSYMLSKYQNEM